ncbi:MAG: hypothetical protein OXC27_16400 [Caldilineaceae bacterium]|nr:hypothetical protein [Caldilineaceae bacterium]
MRGAVMIIGHWVAGANSALELAAAGVPATIGRALDVTSVSV